MFVEVEFGESPAGDQKPCGVGGRPVGEAMLDAVAFQLVRVGSAEDLVARDFGRHDLDDDIAIGEPDYKAIFGSIVFIFGLGNQALASIVVGFTGTTTLIFGLITAVRDIRFAPFT